MPTTPLIIIVTGQPGSGKTTLARRLAADFRLPLVYKDGIKEQLFDMLGWSDREWSRKLGIATMSLLYYFLEIQLAAGVSCIVESNFAPEYATPAFRNLQQKYPFKPFQILCFAEGETLVRRFKERAESHERHPGHVEQLNYTEFEPHLLQGTIEPIDLEGPRYPLDTNDFAVVDYTKLYAAIREVEALLVRAGRTHQRFSPARTSSASTVWGSQARRQEILCRPSIIDDRTDVYVAISLIRKLVLDAHSEEPYDTSRSSANNHSR